MVITITPRKNFSSYFEKEDYFTLLYKSIGDFDRYCNCIDQVTFYNKYLYDRYTLFDNAYLKSDFKNVAINYYDDIESMKNYLKSSSGEDNNIRSILNYITIDKLVGHRYKIIRKLNIDYKNYNRKNYSDSQDVNILDELLLLESALYDFNQQYSSDKQLSKYNIDKINNISILHISKIIDLIDNNIYGLHLLMSEYNKKLINYINEVANLEAIDIEYIHKNIKSMYYDLDKSKWILREYRNEM